MTRACSVCAHLSVALLIAALAFSKLGSVDLGYHLAYGRVLLDTGRIVDSDPFIYAAPGHRFINANWGGQLVMAWVERHFGPVGLQVLSILLIGATTLGVFRASVRMGLASSWWPMVAVLIALAAYERFSLRPELFSYACLSAVLYLLSAPPRRIGIACAAVGLIQIAWVNLHSYFLVGPMLTAAWLMGSGVARLRSVGIAGKARPLVLGAMLTTQLGASLINPHGLEGGRFPVRTLAVLREQGVSEGGPRGAGAGGPWAAISEFHRPLSYVGHPVCRRTIDVYLVLLVFAGVGAAAAVRTGRLELLALIALTTAMSLTMRRNISLFAWTAVPCAAAAIAAWWGEHRASLRWRLLAQLAVVTSCVWWFPRINNGRFYEDETRVARQFGIGYDDRVLPLAACDWINAHSELRPPLLTDFLTSSNVQPWLGLTWPNFVNTNTFAYPPDALASIQAVTIGRQLAAPLLDRHGVNLVLCYAADETKPLIRELLAAPDWALAWFDFRRVIFLRRIDAHRSLIDHAPVAADLDDSAWISDAFSQRHVPPGFELAQMAGVPLCLGWYRPTVSLLLKAVELSPENIDAWVNLGVAHGEQAQRLGAHDGPTPAVRDALQAAQRCFETALRLDPGHVPARLNLDLTRRGLSLFQP